MERDFFRGWWTRSTIRGLWRYGIVMACLIEMRVKMSRERAADKFDASSVVMILGNP